MSRLCGRTVPRRRSMNRCPGTSTTLSAADTAGSGRLHCHGQSGERGGDHVSVVHRTRNRHAHRGAWQSGCRRVDLLPGRRPSQPQPLRPEEAGQDERPPSRLAAGPAEYLKQPWWRVLHVAPRQTCTNFLSSGWRPWQPMFSRRYPLQSVHDPPCASASVSTCSTTGGQDQGFRGRNGATIAASTAVGSTRQVRSPASTAASVGSPEDVAELAGPAG
jgi:hypothetical protein